MKELSSDKITDFMVYCLALINSYTEREYKGDFKGGASDAVAADRSASEDKLLVLRRTQALWD